ncbi:MAG: PEP/pyruvate-binding domain-containing protein [Promethearchaeota archaeon]
MQDIRFSTGIPALDDVLEEVLPGDNIVFQVDKISDFIPFVHEFCKDAVKKQRKLIYFRFADHKSLVPTDIKAEVFELEPEKGFEHFIDEIFTQIERFGKGACYVFDSLSELAVDWYSDRMVANFFMLTCPYLFDFETGTYFALLRNRHSQYTISKIHETAQVILDLYNKNDTRYIHPLKVWKRHSPTMYMLHVWHDGKYHPVLKSAEISEILAQYAQPWVDFTTKLQDIWSQTFNHAYEKVQDYEFGRCVIEDLAELEDKIIRMAITRDSKLYKSVKEYFDLKYLIDIGRRMIGTGLIGGKSVGMLLAQAILKKSNTKWYSKLERHDSFFIGSDVFYTYLVINNCWWIRYKIRKRPNFLELASQARNILQNGKFPEDIVDQFKNLLNYFGQSPIIVRSSSLLEDAYGNAFSGKYESVFLANQGTPEERLEKFMDAVRTVYQSTMSKKALLYRARRNLLDQDEQMAVLVQRVSGSPYGELFYPQLAGVGYSFNPYIWDEKIKPDAGLIRLVFGLGTRAVDRYDDDYTRIVALSAPEMRPESNFNEKQKHNQRKVDVLNLRKNMFNTEYFDKVAVDSKGLPIDLFGSRDYDAEENLRIRKRERTIYYLDLDKKIIRGEIIEDMKEVLHTLSSIYNYPVDVEFTINFLNENDYKIYILQCRPFQVKSGTEIFEEPTDISSEQIILKTEGPIIGHGIAKVVDTIIYVVPETYGKLPIKDRHEVARLIGRLNLILKYSESDTVFLAGPGRWATTSPSLGVPVEFQEINTVLIICEIAEMHENLAPDASLGTHFFNDLVETDMLYMAINPRKAENILNKEEINKMQNKLLKYISDAAKYENVIKVIDTNDTAQKKIKIYADPVKQKAILYFDK